MALPTHKMVTRAQDGIFRPNPRYAAPVAPDAHEEAQSTDDDELETLGLVASEEPASVEEALSTPA